MVDGDATSAGGVAHYGAEHQPARRDFLTLVTLATAAVGVGAIGWTFVDSMNPAADTLAAGAPLDVDLSKTEFEQRAKEWKPRANEYTSGYLWKYAQQVGAARYGALTHPGGAAEKVCYADI